MKHPEIINSKLEKLTLAELHRIILDNRNNDALLKALDLKNIYILLFYLFHLGNTILGRPCFLFDLQNKSTEEIKSKFKEYYNKINKIETPNVNEFTLREVYQILSDTKKNCLLAAFKLGLASLSELSSLSQYYLPKIKSLREECKTREQFLEITATTLEGKNIGDYILPRQINSYFKPDIRYDMISEDCQKQLLDDIERPASPDGLLPADWEQQSLEACVTAVLKTAEAALFEQDPGDTQQSVLRALTYLTIFKQDGDISLISPDAPCAKRRRLQ